MLRKWWVALLCLCMHPLSSVTVYEMDLADCAYREEISSLRRSKRERRERKKSPPSSIPAPIPVSPKPDLAPPSIPVAAPVISHKILPSIKIQSRNDGMFSLFFDVFYSTWEFEHGYFSALQVDFGKNGLYYEPAYGPNWWEYYCEPIRLGKINQPAVDWEYGCAPHITPWNEPTGIPRHIVHECIVKYIHPKKHIVEKVENFCRENYLGNYVIGVHYRGTDKKYEAPRVAYEAAVKAIQRRLDASGRNNPGKPCKIFIATDEQGFIDYVHSLWGNQVCYRETIRSTSGGQPIHYGTNNSPYQLGEEAIIDMLLLSKSDVLIRTSSNLSLWSTYFNPDMPVIELSQRH